VLKVISRSTLDAKRDLESVLETLLESAIRLCGATRGHVYRYDGDFLRFAAAYGAWPGFRAFLQENLKGFSFASTHSREKKRPQLWGA
jgi:two-component system NtrC family sensor kinase